MTRPRHLVLPAALLLALASIAHGADVRFSRHYGNGMALQREKPASIRGIAGGGATVTVSFHPRRGSGLARQKKQTRADGNGAWSVSLDPMPASSRGGVLVAASAGRTAKLNDVLVGDVFLFARQTTIDISLGQDEIGKQAATRMADHPQLRVLLIKTIPTEVPQLDLAKDACGSWSILDRRVALEMSAAAFHLAQGLIEKTDVPIGIIDLNMGHHFPIAWLSKDALLETRAVFGEKATHVDTMMKMMDGARAAYEDTSEDQKKRDRRRGYPRTPAQEDARYPAAGYNAVLHPMRGLALKGLLLQLGNDYPYYIYERLVREGKRTSRPHLGQAYEESYDRYTRAPGLKKPNAWGLYDVHGSVWEMCMDVRHPNYEGAPTDGSAWMSGAPEGKELNHPLRGGGTHSTDRRVRSASRHGYPQSASSHYVGFRISCAARPKAR